MAKEERFEVVVVGAGVCGLAAAKGYVQCAPSTNMLIIDDNKTLGGVWSKENIYPGLRTNNHRGTFEFPDFPFSDEYGISYEEHITGEAMYQYLHDYAERFDLAQRLRLQTTVLEVEKLDGKNEGWKLLVETPQGRSTIFTKKLIVSAGNQSKPLEMTLPGQESYNAPRLHAGSLARKVPQLVSDPKIEHVTIYGGSKFAWDSVYAFASKGKQVDWVIAKTGHGPTWISNVIMTLPLLGRVWAERLVTTRFIDWFSPCIFGGLDGSGWWRSFLNGTWLGRKIIQGFWGNVGADILKQSGFDAHPCLEIIKPDCEYFDIATSFAVLNYPTNILDYVVSGQVKVHRDDITHMSNHMIHLSSGGKFQSDAFIASSGWEWRPKFTFKPESLHAQLGIPSKDYSTKDKEFWAAYDRRADAEIFSRLPILKDKKYPPAVNDESKANTFDLLNPKQPRYEPERLFRCIASPGLAAQGDRSLAFTAPHNISHTLTDEISGTWIYAYFNDKLTIDPQRDLGADRVFYETALLLRWSWRRHTYGFGQRFVDMIYDSIPWNDVLLNDLGLSPTRKKGWGPMRWFREAFVPYTVADYRGVTAEWLEKQKAKSQ